MSVWADMARDAGYAGDEAREVAARLEREAQEAEALRTREQLEAAEDALFATDCSYREAHASAHLPHPQSGRLVCSICHPPMGGAA